MSKRSRLFIIIAVLAVCFAFLWPSLQWYVNTPKDQQALALSSLENIKDYASEKAAADVQQLIASAKADPAAQLTEDQKWLRKAAEKNFKEMEKAVPSPLTLREALESFETRADFVTLVESRYRDRILKNKKYYQNSVKLGLDLSGGMNVIVRADLDAVVEAQKGSVADLEQLRKCENRRRAASVGENLDDNPRLLKGPYDSFGSALVKSGLLCEDACGEDGHSEQVWRDGRRVVGAYRFHQELECRLV